MSLCTWNNIERSTKNKKKMKRPAREEKVSRARTFDYTAAKALASVAAAVATHNSIFLEPKSVQTSISLASSICYLVVVASGLRCCCVNKRVVSEKLKQKYLRRYRARVCLNSNEDYFYLLFFSSKKPSPKHRIMI